MTPTETPLPRPVRILAVVVSFAFAALVTFVVAAILTGCSASLRDVAVTTANSTQTVLVESKEVITAACEPAYRAATTLGSMSKFAEADEACMPAVRAYDALRAAWVLGVAAIGAAEATGNPADLGPAVAEMGRALVLMRAALKGLPR